MVTSVTFDPNAGGDGSTVSDDNSPTTGLADGGHRLRFVPALKQVVAMMSWFAARAIANLTFGQMLAIASPAQGRRVFVTDVGINGSEWIYSGSRWVPVGGSVIIARGTGSLASPVATLSGITSGGFSLPGGNPLLFGYLLTFGSRVRVNAMVRKNGANATWGVAARFGTTNSASDNTLYPAGTQTNADNRQVWVFCEAVVYGATGYTTQGAITPNNSGTASAADRASNFNTASFNYVGFYISAASASDSFDLVWYEVEVRP